MATVKSLTSKSGLEGSFLRCQGHIGRSDRQRLRMLSVFLLVEAKMPPYAAFAPFISDHNKVVFFTRRHFRERDRDREREREFGPLSGFRYTGTLRPVPVYRTEATRIGALGITAAYRQPYKKVKEHAVGK